MGRRVFVAWVGSVGLSEAGHARHARLPCIHGQVARKARVHQLKAEHYASSTLRRRLARRGSSLEPGDSLSDSAEWSSTDERRATMPMTVEEYVAARGCGI